ncbi:MAG: acylneuraminate cytidylyltransferase family protein [Anaerolineaceae bacterium]|nr:acylneuraminate cytidylyltransferase family protein [Anaerolineaceae bacterium]MDD4043280.1 acylneuraminate cytidylyltransferase family protein [Anaerolineaceae bacterium]MDD4577178.1 acylneuraminate cytidylyltransferase family protein [Anaerolineaceae bacterium]
MKLERIVALVPMRHDSKRVPGKNYRPMCGKPLYAHIVETLLSCPEIAEVVVDTDSPIIIDGLAKDYPQVTVLRRPEELRADTTPTNEILVHDTSLVGADLYLQTHSTNPLLKSATISRAIQQLRELYPEHDSLFSVTRLQTRFWDQLGRAINHNPAVLLRTQDLPPIYEENSCLYLFTRETLLNRRNRLGDRPFMFEMDAREATDIDEELDFVIAETLMKIQE